MGQRHGYRLTMMRRNKEYWKEKCRETSPNLNLEIPAAVQLSTEVHFNAFKRVESDGLDLSCEWK